MKTVEEVVRIINRFEDGVGITEAYIVNEVKRDNISAEAITDESIFSRTKYDFLVLDKSISYLLQERYSLNALYINSLLED
ncbi:hypothetical protein [Lysinibacillus capsici]|uniref:hypothetical protein n=1 Tax=Lysinibacillus capsici TaxID=2115968 RepID=UPI003D037633